MSFLHITGLIFMVGLHPNLKFDSSFIFYNSTKLEYNLTKAVCV